MQLLLKAMRLHGHQLSFLSLIMDVFETPACHTKYPPRPRPRYYHSKLQNSYPSNTDSISSSQETHTLHRYPSIPFIDPTYHATNGIRPHNPQVHPLPFLSTAVLLHNMVLRPAHLFPRLPYPVLSLPIYLHSHRSVLGGCLDDGRVAFLHTLAALELAKEIGEFVDLVELDTWRLTRGRCRGLVF